MRAQGTNRFEFCGYLLDLHARTLSRGDRLVAIRPKSFDLLAFLVQNPGRVVSKDELIAAIWPNVIATDESLSRCVSDLRLAIDDSERQAVRTVPCRGYQFAAAVAAAQDPAAPGAPWSERFKRRRVHVSVAAILALLACTALLSALYLNREIGDRLDAEITGAAPPAVAALPFESLSSEQALYNRGMQLVAPRKRLDVEGIAQAQEAFAKAIELNPDYAPAYAGLAWAIWLDYESGKIHISTDKAFRLAEKSLSIGENALAHRVLAKRYFSVFSLHIPEQDIGRAVEELQRAHSLQPDDPDATADLAMTLSFAGRPAEAVALIQRAMRRNPQHPAWYYAASGIAYLFDNQPERAIRDLNFWSNSDPTFHLPYAFLAAAYGLSGRVEYARAALKRNRQLCGSSNVFRANRRWQAAAAEQQLFLRGLKAAGF